MTMNAIEERIAKFLADGDIAQGILLVRKNDHILYLNKWGYAHIEEKKEVTYDSIFRMMSMTKCVTAVAILKLIDEGKIWLDDPLSKFIPKFKHASVVDDRRFSSSKKVSLLRIAWSFLFFNPKTIKTRPAKREITIRDLLSHSSGIQQGLAGFIRMIKNKQVFSSNDEAADYYASFPIDFEPGEGTGYSPLAGFDLLIKVIEVASGMKAERYFKEHIFKPLDMENTSFFPTDEQQKRLVQSYMKKGRKLVNVTSTKHDIDSFIKRTQPYICGSGGLYSTLTDFDHFLSMLLANGIYQEKVFLRKETVDMMHSELPQKHLEPEPGNMWGAGVKIRQNPKLQKSSVTEGSYGWSGAFGTHFVISPKDHLSMLWLTNLTNAGGSGSKVSKAVEDLVFETFAHHQ